jgi:hypothetical protein
MQKRFYSDTQKLVPFINADRDYCNVVPARNELPIFWAQFDDIGQPVLCVQPYDGEAVTAGDMPICNAVIEGVWPKRSFNHKASPSRILAGPRFLNRSVEVKHGIDDLRGYPRHPYANPPCVRRACG